MRSIKRKLCSILSSLALALSLAVCPIPTQAIPPPLLVQNCQKLNGGTATQFYSVVIGSGGTTGCTRRFTPGDMIAVGYGKLSGSALTAGSISATGATVTWHATSFSLSNSVFGPPGYLSGILYACPQDISSPTSSITVTVNMGASMADMTSINVYEITHILATGGSCHDSAVDHGQSTSTCNTATNGVTTGTASGTLAGATEFIFVVGWAYGTTSCSTSPPITFTAGTSAGTTSFGNFTIPSNGQGGCTATTFGEAGCQTMSEYVVVLSNASGISYATQSPAPLSGNLVSTGFIGGPGPNQQRPRLLEY